MLILGSQSPNRKRLLSYLHIPFRVAPSRFDETSLNMSNPTKLAEALAFNKATTLYHKYPKDIILTADTLIYHQGNILGKPSTPADARRMLRLLRGFTHSVITAYCLLGEGLRSLKLDQIEYIKPHQFHALDTTHHHHRLTFQKPLPYLLNHDTSRITMRSITNTEIDLYLSLEDPTRFAGSYAILDSISIIFADQITGSLSNIIGLPLEKLTPILTRLYPHH